VREPRRQLLNLCSAPFAAICRLDLRMAWCCDGTVKSLRFFLWYTDSKKLLGTEFVGCSTIHPLRQSSVWFRSIV
jgi:hypothetical protein